MDWQGSYTHHISQALLGCFKPDEDGDGQLSTSQLWVCGHKKEPLSLPRIRQLSVVPETSLPGTWVGGWHQAPTGTPENPVPPPHLQIWPPGCVPPVGACPPNPHASQGRGRTPSAPRRRSTHCAPATSRCSATSSGSAGPKAAGASAAPPRGSTSGKRRKNRRPAASPTPQPWASAASHGGHRIRCQTAPPRPVAPAPGTGAAQGIASPRYWVSPCSGSEVRRGK